jgi:hypothetical protein
MYVVVLTGLLTMLHLSFMSVAFVFMITDKLYPYNARSPYFIIIINLLKL